MMNLSSRDKDLCFWNKSEKWLQERILDWNGGIEKAILHPFNEPGRRLKAAIVSYIAGYTGVDSTLERVPEDAGEQWAALAERLICQILKDVDLPKLLVEEGEPQSVQ